MRIKSIHAETGQRYGSRRMTRARQAEGYQVGRGKVRRCMQEAGVSVQRRTTRTPHTTDSRHDSGVAPNVLHRECDVNKPNEAWVGEITYLWTQEGWLYLAVLLDLDSRTVVGWSLSSPVDSELVQGALEMAIGRRHPEAGLIHHTDRGAQYASHAYRDMLRNHAMVCRMSGQGDCVDHAVAERFCGSLTRERTSHRHYETRQEARADVIDYIEMFYNSTRLHSYLGYTSPNEYEKMPRAASLSVRFCLTTTTQPSTVLLTLFKIATHVRQYKDRMLLYLPTSCPVKALLHRGTALLTAIPLPTLNTS